MGNREVVVVHGREAEVAQLDEVISQSSGRNASFARKGKTSIPPKKSRKRKGVAFS